MLLCRIRAKPPQQPDSKYTGVAPLLHLLLKVGRIESVRPPVSVKQISNRCGNGQVAHRNIIPHAKVYAAVGVAPALRHERGRMVTRVQLHHTMPERSNVDIGKCAP